MEKKNANANVNVAETATELEKVVEETVPEEIEEVQLTLSVHRTSVRQNGKVYNNYFVSSTMRGKEIKADLVASDLGGYETLNIIYGEDKVKNLGIERAVRQDAAGKVVRYNTYYIKGEDEFGIEIKVPVRPRETSDRTYLEYIIQREQYLLEHPDVVKK